MSEDEQKDEALSLVRGAEDKGKTPTMHVKVYSPYRTYFDDAGYSVSAVNASGPFDILPHHHNFITLLSPCELQVRSKRGDAKIRISGGLMHVKSDQIIVFLDV